VLPPNGEPTQERRLRIAIEKASVPPRDYRIFMALHYRAQWVTAAIPERFQPRSVEEIARIANINPTTAAEGLTHLERHGWLVRHRTSGRSRSIAYALAVGKDCDCPAAAPKTGRLPDAERARRYRERKKASRGIPVTEADPSRDIAAMRHGVECDEFAGQVPYLDEVGVERERVEKEGLSGWPAGSMGDWENGAA
jgi:hypothetical protein